MIRTTKKVEEATALTHAGYFHADEVFATVIMSHKINDLVVARVTKVPEACEKLVYDIGGGRYDHHQTDKRYREDGLPYAAVGLIWEDFGKDVLLQMGVEEKLISSVWAQIDQSLIRGIDASDNGVSLNGCYDILTINKIIGIYNPEWDETKEADTAFLEACTIADQIFNRVVKNVASEMRSIEYVREAMRTAKGRIIYLEKYVPWQRCVCMEDVEDRFLFVVYPSNRGGYNVQSVPTSPESFEMRQGLPQIWRGLRGEELRLLTGIEDAEFVHSAGFIGGAGSLQGALMMAEKAINALDIVD